MSYLLCMEWILEDFTQMMKHKMCVVLGGMGTWLDGVFLGEK